MEAIILQQIAPFIAHNLKVDYKAGMHYGQSEISGADLEGVKIIGLDMWLLYQYVKPILYPISSITKPIINNGVEIVPIEELFKLSVDWNENDCNLRIKVDGLTAFRQLHIQGYWDDRTQKDFFSEFIFSINKINGNRFDFMQKLAEWHINFLNIPDHLFIDKSTVKI